MQNNLNEICIISSVSTTFAKYLGMPNTGHLKIFAQSLSNHHLGKETSKQINTQLSLYHTGADIAIVYLACGEPESVGESLRFSFYS